MISKLVLGKRINNDLINFIGNQLFITHENKRYPIKTLSDIKLLMRESSFAIRKEEKGCTTAVLFVWKSNSLNVSRNYIKIAYKDIIDVDDVLMVLNWNFNKEVYIELSRNSPLIDSFRKKGFKRCHSREDEVLLCRSSNDKHFIPPYKGDDDEDTE